MKRLTEDELDIIQDRIFNSLFYGVFITVGLIASLYCGVVLWAI